METYNFLICYSAVFKKMCIICNPKNSTKLLSYTKNVMIQYSESHLAVVSGGSQDLPKGARTLCASLYGGLGMETPAGSGAETLVGSQAAKPLKLKAFCPFYYKRGAKS